MATYVIGDVQGCFDSLLALLEVIDFHPERDRLWFVGDLVNRGPKSLQMLRWAVSMGDRVSSVLGNHDLHLLMCAAGVSRTKKDDTLAKVLNAHDNAGLIDWLRRRPLIHVEGKHALVHAGVHPTWTIAQAQSLAREVEALLLADDWQLRIGELRGEPPPWSPSLKGPERLRTIAAVLLRMRTLTPDGRLAGFTGEPKDAPRGDHPWFDAPDARWRDHVVIFGHWSALGLRMEESYIGLDTGCVWGRELTALHLEDRELFQVRAVEQPQVRNLRRGRGS